MTDPTERARALREAARIAPDDATLRRMLAEALLAAGEPANAEAEFRAALRLEPGDEGARLGLARTFQRQGKLSAALVVLEDALRGGAAGREARLLHARLLLEAGETERAREEYRALVAADPGAEDVELAARLGSGPEQRVRRAASGADQEDTPEVPAERPGVTFADVGGMESLKEEIRLKIIHPLTHPELYRAYGKRAGGGILMYGPPGCGKTHLARAVAGEVDAAFISVGIHEVLDMWMGQSERNLNALFESARSQAPCVLFFDEVDALAGRRSDLRSSAARPLVNQLLAEMDGVDGGNEGVLVLAATNAPWHLDPAFRRPGRFDRVLFVPPPDEAARVGILRILCRDLPRGEIDFGKVAKKTDAFSGADLKAVVELAVERKLPEAIRAGRPVPLATADLLDAAKGVRPATKEWFSTARNYVLYANESGLYDDVKRYL